MTAKNPQNKPFLEQKNPTFRENFVYFFVIMAHKALVFLFLARFCAKLMKRALFHDMSKFSKRERKIFAASYARHKYIEKVYGYGSKEYKESMHIVNQAVAAHYAKNDHHPEYFFVSNIYGMDLIQLTEMLADWYAASKDIWGSMAKNKERFKIDETLHKILVTTMMRRRFGKKPGHKEG